MTYPGAPHICFVVESGTDVRLVEELAARLPVTILARDIPGGRAVSQTTTVPVVIGTSGRFAFAWSAFRRLLRPGVGDAILVQGCGLSALAANLAARITRKPCWMLVCSPAEEYYTARRRAGAPFSRVMLAAIRALGYANSLLGRRYIVLSEHLRDVVRRYGATARIEIIPVYGVDVRQFDRRLDVAAARAARGLPAHGRIIFSSSRVAPEKDTDTLMRAFASLVAEGRDVYLLSRCGGYREVLALAGQAGAAVRARVIATDAVDPRGDLSNDYAAADVCVQASRAEGLGFSVLEALACGTPVVASAVGGLTETVRDGVTGWSVPPGDAASLAAALREVLDQPAEARRRTAAGSTMVRERFDTPIVFARLASVLEGAATT